MHTSIRRLSRRSIFRLAGVGFTAGPALTACNRDTSRDTPDVLIGHEQAARADAAAATAAITAAPTRADTLKVVAAERTAHAEALHAEIERAAGVYRDGTVPAHAVAAGAPIPGSAPTLQQLRDQLGAARRSAADLAGTESGYRAGLLGSISAACAVQVEVLLK